MPEVSPTDSTPAHTSNPTRGPKRRWSRIILLATGCLLLLVALAAATGVLWLRSVTRAALPQLDGDVHLAGLSAPVTIRRDAHGVPHIDAASLNDMLIAQGYITAQDRLWQMDMLRRHANGELAEVLGSALTRHDKTQRVLQIRLTAERIYNNSPATDRARLDDYARGVNLFIAQAVKSNSLPVEFRLLMYRPQPWRGVDCISVGLSMVQELDMHAATKLDRAQISAALRNPRLEADLYPVGSWRDRPPTGVKVDLREPQPLPAPAKNSDDEDDDENTETRIAPAIPGGAQVDSAALKGQGFSRATAVALNGHGFSRATTVAQTEGALAPEVAPVDLRAISALLGQPACGACMAGSNNWVVAGGHTASGKPMLANDMHLDLSVPNIWYMASLAAPGFHAAGVTLPGMPLIIAGHNEHVAWGFTALLADVQDLYYEKLDGKGNYQGMDAQWHPLAVDREVIHVRSGKDLALDVESTEHGPLMNPILPSGSQPVALKWTLYVPALNAIPLYEMNTAFELAGVLRRARAVELAYTESGLCRRPGTHRIPRHRKDSDSAVGSD